MKGKTGKPAMRGGGMARKGTGMALKGGGMARKGTGSNATPGGKKLADGGMSAMKALPPHLGGSPNPPSDTPMVRPGFPSRGTPDRGKEGASGGGGGRDRDNPRRGPMKPGMSGGKGGPGSGTTIQQGGRTTKDLPFPVPSKYQVGMPAPGYSLDGKKNGGKVSKYAKGGAVKMTAGSGSGSGRLEKVAAHKAAKRIPAANLKSGGKVKGK